MTDKQARALGGVCALLFGFVLVVGVLAVTRWDQFPRIANTGGVRVDYESWLFHWRLRAGIHTAAGLLGSAGGLAAILRRRWGFILVASAAASLAAADLTGRLTGFSVYTFEFEEFGALALLVGMTLAAASAWLSLRRWNPGRFPDNSSR